MQDVLDIIKNIESIYDSNTSFQVLKDFERVIDELDIYVYANWKDGELVDPQKSGLLSPMNYQPWQNVSLAFTPILLHMLRHVRGLTKTFIPSDQTSSLS